VHHLRIRATRRFESRLPAAPAPPPPPPPSNDFLFTDLDKVVSDLRIDNHSTGAGGDCSKRIGFDVLSRRRHVVVEGETNNRQTTQQPTPIFCSFLSLSHHTM